MQHQLTNMQIIASTPSAHRTRDCASRTVLLHMHTGSQWCEQQQQAQTPQPAEMVRNANPKLCLPLKATAAAPHAFVAGRVLQGMVLGVVFTERDFCAQRPTGSRHVVRPVSSIFCWFRKEMPHPKPSHPHTRCCILHSCTTAAASANRQVLLQCRSHPPVWTSASSACSASPASAAARWPAGAPAQQHGGQQRLPSAAAAASPPGTPMPGKG